VINLVISDLAVKAAGRLRERRYCLPSILETPNKVNLLVVIEQ